MSVERLPTVNIVYFSLKLSYNFFPVGLYKMDATSKTAKKNKKRKGKKTSIKLGSSDHDADQVLSILKEELVIAKREKVNWDSDQIIHIVIFRTFCVARKVLMVVINVLQDHAKAGKLRDQIWVLTDIVAGIK